MDEEELSYSVVDNVHTVLHPTFGLAVKDDIIRKNLSDGVLGEIKKNLGKNSGIRHALTRDQQRVFVGLLDLPENAKWKPVITFLLGTGCRVGECIGIRWQDVDFEGRMISINHSVSYLSRRGGGKGKSGFCVFEPKTRAGKRTIPLLETVRDALIEYKSIEEALGSPRDLIVDGMSGFIFLNRFGNLYTLQSINVTANLN